MQTQIIQAETHPELFEQIIERRTKAFAQYGETVYGKAGPDDLSKNAYFIVTTDNENKVLAAKRLIISDSPEGLSISAHVNLSECMDTSVIKRFADQGGFFVRKDIKEPEVRGAIIKQLSDRMFDFLKDEKVDVLAGLAFEQGLGFKGYCDKNGVQCISGKIAGLEGKGAGDNLMLAMLNPGREVPVRQL
jgi:hypothetical protein